MEKAILQRFPRKSQPAFLRRLHPPYALSSPPRRLFYLEKPQLQLQKEESKIRSKVHA
jgi:hypothetical protein